MKILKAKKEDLKDVGKLMKNEFSKSPFNEKNTMNAILKSLEFYFRLGEIFLAVENKNIIGVIVIKFEQYWEGKVMIIEDLAVDEKFQKLGVGKKLMEFVENYSKKKGVKFILFSTNAKSRAIDFYENIGYKIDRERIFMRKKLK